MNDDNIDKPVRAVSNFQSDDNVWSWKNTKKDLQALHMDPFYSISSTSGLQLRKTFNFNHAIDYLAATTSFGGETFIAVQSLASKSIVHIWNTVQHKNCKVKLQYRINSFIIVNSLMIGVALCGDGKLRIYTSVPTLVEVAAFELVKPATYPVFNPFNKDILLGGINEVNLWRFREERKGERKNPLSEVTRMNLERGASFCPGLGDQWVTCITVNERSSQVVIGAETLVSIVDAHTYTLKTLIRTDIASTITQCTMYNAMDYTITGHQDGSVNIWSTTTHNNIQHIKAHQAKLTGLEVHTGMGLLITISLDKTIKVIRLSSMEEVYSIMTGDRMTNLRVLDRNSLAYCTKYSVKVWNLYQVDSLVNRLFSEVYRIRRTGEGQLLVETEDGGLRLLNVRCGDVVTTVFSSTNTANFNLKYSAYSSSHNMAFILDPEAGHVEGYNCETHPADLQTLYKTEGQKVNAICEAYLGIPYWLPTAKRSKTRSETMLSLVLVGTAEGQLIVADAPDWLHLPLPVNIERGMVKDMEASSAGEGKKKCTVAVLTGENPCYISVYLLSISTDNNLSINLRHVLTLTTPITLFLISDIYLMISFSNRVSLVKFPSILEKDSLHSTVMELTTSICEPYVEIYKQVPTDCHTKTVTDMDALSTLEIFVTVAAEDFFLKLWDNKNILLREILFSTPVYGITFATDYGVLFCSNSTNLTVIPVSKYLPPQYIQRLLNCEGDLNQTTESLKAVPSTSTCVDPEEVPVSLSTRRKEKMNRLERGDGRYSRRKRDPPRDDDSSRGGRRRGEEGRRGGGGGASSGGSSRSNKSCDKSSNKSSDKSTSQDQGRENTPTDGGSERSHKAALDAVVEDAVVEENALQVAEWERKCSEFSILDNSFPCAPDGYIPNSVARIMFTHLLEFRLLFNEHRVLRPPTPPSESFGIISIPSKDSIRTIIEEEEEVESVMDIIVTGSSNAKLVVSPTPCQVNIGDGYSALFLSTTGSSESEATMESTTPLPSTHLLNEIDKSEQSLKEKRSAFAGVALSEAPSYASAERVPRPDMNSSQRSIRFDVDGRSTTTLASTITEVAEKVDEYQQLEEVKIVVPAKKRKFSNTTSSRKGSKMRRPTITKQKKRRGTKLEGSGLKKREGTQEVTSKTDEVKSNSSLTNSKSVMSSQSGDIPVKPTVTITSIPEMNGAKDVLDFKEHLKEIKTLADPRERLMLLSQWVDRVQTDAENFLFIKNLDEFLNVENKPNLTDKEVEIAGAVTLKLYESNKIDSVHYTELLKSIMDCGISDFMKFDVLSSIIKVHRRNKDSQARHGAEMKDVLMDILPFLVHEDEKIKDRAFQELSDYADINTKKELRELLIGMNIMSSTSNPNDIEIVSDGKILNIQYWRNKVENPEPSLSCKVSEEIQIVSEFEIQVDSNKTNNKPPKKTLQNPPSQRKTPKVQPSLKRASRDLLRQNTPITTQTPPGSLADIAEDYKFKSDSTLGQYSTFDPDMNMGEYLEGESEEDTQIRIPSIDIKRRIMSCTGREIKEREYVIGEVRDRGKLFNSNNDLMLWFQKDDDQFYDSDSRVVGSLLPNGNVSVPDNLNLVVDSYIVNEGRELVRFAGNRDNQGRIKNHRGENLGTLTREGEFISKDGILFTCDGMYAGKMCPDGNRMYVNGEIFNKQNAYWGHVGPDNTMIHLSGRIFDSSGVAIGNIMEYGEKLSSCVQQFDTYETQADSGVSLDDVYVNREVKDDQGEVLGKFKNKDTIITTCGDIFDRNGAYLGQLLANGHIMMKEEATKLSQDGLRSTLVTQGRSRIDGAITKPSSRKTRVERLRAAVADHQAAEAKEKKSREIGEEWEKHRSLPSEESLKSDMGYQSEDKLLFDLTQSVPLLPTLNEVKGQRLVKTITFSRSVSSFQNKNVFIEPMPSTLNAHTTRCDGNTNFGMLKVDWTTRSIDAPSIEQTKLPKLQRPPPPSAAVKSQQAALASTTLPRLPQIGRHPVVPHTRNRAGSGDYLLKTLSSYLQKELKEEMSLIRGPVVKSSLDSGGSNAVCNTPISRRV
ncbi:hypothetical protein ACHWQZ_G019045 [Mnemiopsis leidyi]